MGCKMENEIVNFGCSLSVSKQLVCDLCIREDGITSTYSPKEDITTFELSLLIRVFMSFNTHDLAAQTDYWSYIKEHKLERHFIKD